MKRSTADSRLRDVADGLDRAVSWPETRVSAAYVFGAFLNGGAELDRVELAIAVDEPAEAVPWLARPAHLEAMAAHLRFTKLPVSWRWRPAGWPVWNHMIDRAVRFWTADRGRDDQVLDALAAGRLADVVVEAPADRDALVAQLQIERDTSRAHLVMVTESFYNRDWRRAHTGEGVHPEDHLWWASAALLELDDAARQLHR